MSTKETGPMVRGTSKKTTVVTLLLLIVCVIAAVVFIKLFEKEVPQVEMQKDLALFGPSTTISFVAADRRSGLREIIISLRQGDKSASIFHKTETGFQTNKLMTCDT